MPTYHLFPFMDDESATVFNEPILVLEADQPPTEITDQMLEQILVNLGTPPNVAMGREYQEMADDVWREHGLLLDSCAVIQADDDTLEFLKDIGDDLMEGCGSDSCWYRASAVFSRILKHKAVVVIDFPYPSEEAF